MVSYMAGRMTEIVSMHSVHKRDTGHCGTFYKLSPAKLEGQGHPSLLEGCPDVPMAQDGRRWSRLEAHQ